MRIVLGVKINGSCRHKNQGFDLDFSGLGTSPDVGGINPISSDMGSNPQKFSCSIELTAFFSHSNMKSCFLINHPPVLTIDRWDG
jgi:hypothetical protein